MSWAIWQTYNGEKKLKFEYIILFLRMISIEMLLL